MNPIFYYFFAFSVCSKICMTICFVYKNRYVVLNIIFIANAVKHKIAKTH